MQAGSKKFKWHTPFKILFHFFFATLNSLLVLLLIASAFSDYFSPEKHVVFAYAGLVFPVILFFNLCFLIYWLFTKKWFMVFVLTASFIVCWKPILRFCPLNLKTTTLPQEDVIKILSYNVMSFAYKNHTEKSPNKIIEYIAESGADIVCLQEYMVSSRDNLMNSQDVAEALPMYPYISEIIFSSHENNRYKYGLALLSKFPITSSKRIPYASTYNGSSIHNINVHGKKITVLNNHLESFKLTAEDRSNYSDMIAHANFELLDELGGSIQQKLGQAFKTRASQADIIADEIYKTNSYYTIVCGDFNDTPTSYAHRIIQGPLIDAYEETGFGPGISYNQNYFFFRIDHIFHSQSMESYNCTVDTRVKLSDHYPIHCYLKMF
jgi:Metal-dependent hydrolase